MLFQGLTGGADVPILFSSSQPVVLLLAPRIQAASTPPCGTGPSAALKPRFAVFTPRGFHPWRKNRRAGSPFPRNVHVAAPPWRVRVRTGFAVTG